MLRASPFTSGIVGLEAGGGCGFKMSSLGPSLFVLPGLWKLHDHWDEYTVDPMPGGLLPRDVKEAPGRSCGWREDMTAR